MISRKRTTEEKLERVEELLREVKEEEDLSTAQKHFFLKAVDAIAVLRKSLDY